MPWYTLEAAIASFYPKPGNGRRPYPLSQQCQTKPPCSTSAICWKSKGTIVDATLINAPSSINNTKGKRDPDMHQTKKGKQWYFGMKTVM